MPFPFSSYSQEHWVVKSKCKLLSSSRESRRNINIISEINNDRYLGQDNMFIVQLLFIFPFKSQKMHIGWIRLMFRLTFNLIVQSNCYMHYQLYNLIVTRIINCTIYNLIVTCIISTTQVLHALSIVQPSCYMHYQLYNLIVTCIINCTI